MKKNDLKELRSKTAKSIEKRIADSQSELVQAKLKLKRADLKNVRTPKLLKRDIAQMKTILKEKKLFKNIEETK